MEISAILIFSLFITSAYLDFDPNVIPAGREYPPSVQPYYIWTHFRQCGTCIMWNGMVKGGVPSFAEIHAAVLHPLPVLATLLFGMPSGMKLTLAGAFFMAGLAQWWLGRRLRVGRLACVWTACLAVASGGLSSRMEAGWINLVLSIAASALIFPALIGLAQTLTRRWAALLGSVLAMAALSGQGYVQLGAVAVLPLVLILVRGDQLALMLRRLGLSALVAFLIAAPLLVPMLRMASQYNKDADLEFKTSQSFRFVPLNLVIDDPVFYTTTGLERQTGAALYASFIGWIPVLCAMYALFALAARERWPGERKHALFLVASAFGLWWIGSAMPLRWLIALSPLDWLDWRIAQIRNPAFIAGLAVVPILALAALGADRLWKRAWPELSFSLARGATQPLALRLDTRWVLILPLLLALSQAAHFSRLWVRSERIDASLYTALEALRTSSLEWVSPPFGEQAYQEPAMRMGLKLSSDLKDWSWRDRPPPDPFLEARARSGAAPGLIERGSFGNHVVFEAGSERHYATVRHAAGTAICQGHGIGGDIDVTCNTPAAGQLTVKEHDWSGWRAYVDGERVRLKGGAWLALDLPEGRHLIQLRYRPWDLPFGAILGIIGWALAGYLIWRGDPVAARADRQAADSVPVAREAIG